MKRTYQGYAGGAPPATPAPGAPLPQAGAPAYPYSTPQQHPPYAGPAAQPPLPPGAPPPQPHQPYQQPQQQQQQYPGYGYGGQQPAQQTQHGYTNYFPPQTPATAGSAPAPAPQQQYPGYGYGGTQGQQHAQAGQYANYGYGGQAANQHKQPPQQYPGYQPQYPQVTPTPPYQPQPAPGTPQPYSHAPYTPQPAASQPPAGTQPYAYPQAIPPPPAPGQPSPSGAPPYKRPRYDGAGGPAPAPAAPYPPPALPPALPPLANASTPPRGGAPRGGARGGFAGGARGRGGYSGSSPAPRGDGWEGYSGEGYYGSGDGYYDGSGGARGGAPFRGGGAGRGGAPLPRSDHRDFSGGSNYSGRGGMAGPPFAGPMRGSAGMGGRGGRGAGPLPPRDDRFATIAGPKGPRAGNLPNGPGLPRPPPGVGPRGSPGGWDRMGRFDRGRGGKALGGLRNGGRHDDRVGGGKGAMPSSRSGGRGKAGWGKDSKEYGDKDRKEETSKRTLTDFRINALDVADLSWGWIAEVQTGDINAESLDGVLNASANAAAIPKPTDMAPGATEGEKKGKHGRDEEEDQDAMDDGGAGTGKKKVKSEAAAEEARKADETAEVTASAITTNGTESEPKVDEDAQNAEAAARAVKELKVEDDVPAAPDTSTDDDHDSAKEVDQSLIPTVTAAEPVTPKVEVDAVAEAIKRAEASSLEPPPASSSQDAKPHSYSRPTIPAGRENSRLRIYFASPSTTAVLDDGTDSHGHSRNNGVAVGSKRKLSVGAQSAMSVDTKPLSSPKPAGTPLAKINPVPEEETIDGAPMPSEPPTTVTGDSKEELAPTSEKIAENGTESIAPPADGNYPPQPYPPSEGTAVTQEPKECDAPADSTGPAIEGSTAEGMDDDNDEEEPPMPEPSPDRISISYARNTRRLVIDSDVVNSVKVYRAEHKVEVVLRLLPAIVKNGKYAGEPDEYRVCKGVLVESLDPEADDYVIIDRATLEATWQLQGQPEPEPPEGAEDHFPGLKHDPLLPPLHRLLNATLGEGSSGVSTAAGFSKDTILIVAKLDTANPLTEAKWVRTGDVDSWISQMTGRVFRGDNEDDCGWRRKITVADPDPAPTIQHLLDTWLTTSNVGTIDTRQRFIDRHISKDADNIIEILLRVVRGTSVPHHPSSQPLVTHQAATLRAPYPEQQTQVSLAVLGMYRLAVETAIEGGVPKELVIKKATDIVRNLPYRMAFSALDGIYKDEQAS